MICNECETVAHCTKHGCVPKQPAPVPLTDEQISAIGSKIFPSTWNPRHVEFARAIEAAQPAQQHGPYSAPVKELWPVAPKAAAQPAVPDAIGPNEDELPAYAAGWNDCRQTMLEMMK